MVLLLHSSPKNRPAWWSEGGESREWGWGDRLERRWGELLKLLKNSSRFALDQNSHPTKGTLETSRLDFSPKLPLRYRQMKRPYGQNTFCSCKVPSVQLVIQIAAHTCHQLLCEAMAAILLSRTYTHFAFIPVKQPRVPVLKFLQALLLPYRARFQNWACAS